jgi:hypothetical protein
MLVVVLTLKLNERFLKWKTTAVAGWDIGRGFRKWPGRRQ